MKNFVCGISTKWTALVNPSAQSLHTKAMQFDQSHITNQVNYSSQLVEIVKQRSMTEKVWWNEKRFEVMSTWVMWTQQKVTLQRLQAVSSSLNL